MPFVSMRNYAFKLSEKLTMEDQVIRGMRVELREIESLEQHPAVQTTVVMAQKDGHGDQSLQEGRLPTEYVAPRNTVELELTKIWSVILGVQPIGVRENFFDLGGHSLLAVRLFTQIKKIFGKNLPLATLFQAPTVEQLANILCQSECSAACESLVTIQTGGSKPPLFCVHGAYGNVLLFQNLVRCLSSNQPVYGLQAKGLDGKQAPHTRIEDMAADYIKQIRTVQPEGPYLLVGYSSGGVVAFEMAQQLQAQGEKVPLLALLDTHGSVYYQPLSLRDWVSRHLGELLRLEPKEKLTYLVAGTKERLQKIAHNKFYLGIGLSSPQAHKKSTQTADLIANSQPATYNVVYTTQRQALTYYVPQVYSGRVILFRSAEQPWWIANDLQLGWCGLADPGIEIQEVPGNHFNMFNEPYVRVLAEKLRACL